MKKRRPTTFSSLFSTALMFLALNGYGQNISINSTGASPDESALLDLSSDSKGFLITRADTIDISSPAFGLMTLAPKDSCLYMHNGETSGRKWISLGGVGDDCPCGIPEPYCGPDLKTTVSDVTNPVTGKTWMDRNLGASQVATNSMDSDAYGDLYQWGRCADGHEKRNSSTTTSQSSVDDPEHGSFINDSYDWRDPRNDNLWQGAAGINNPCPDGYRIPTETELNNERQSWSSNDAAGAFASPLKLTVAGDRKYNTGEVLLSPEFGYYWSSTVSGAFSKSLYLLENDAKVQNHFRASGFSVRCIKD